MTRTTAQPQPRPVQELRPAALGVQERPGRHGSRGLAFLREFLKNPNRTAAIAPSSPRLAERMLSGLDLAPMRSIVEYGPGTGVFTRAVLERLPDGWLSGCTDRPGLDGRAFVAVEFNPELARFVKESFPTVCVENESAERVEAICARHGIAPGELDLIISGLGWVGFEPGLCTRMLEATHRMLRPGAEFRTFGYHLGLVMPHAGHFRREIKRLFSTVHTTKSVWANLPPAFVYVCRK